MVGMHCGWVKYKLETVDEKPYTLEKLVKRMESISKIDLLKYVLTKGG